MAKDRMVMTPLEIYEADLLAFEQAMHRIGLFEVLQAWQNNLLTEELKWLNS